MLITLTDKSILYPGNVFGEWEEKSIYLVYRRTSAKFYFPAMKSMNMLKFLKQLHRRNVVHVLIVGTYKPGMLYMY